MLLFIPLYILYILQPLDLACFGPLKTSFRTELQHRRGYTAIDRVPRDVIVELYIQARQAGLTKSNIEAGWAKSGIHPLNTEIPLSSKFVKEVANRERPVSSPSTEN